MRFNIKSSAVDYINRKTNDTNLRLFQQDKGTEGKKWFHVLNPNEIYNIIKKKSKAHYYESWTEKSKLLFGLDLDIQNEENKKNYNIILVNIIKNIIKYAEDFYDHTYEVDDFILLKTKDRKADIVVKTV